MPLDVFVRVLMSICESKEEESQHEKTETWLTGDVKRAPGRVSKLGVHTDMLQLRHDHASEDETRDF